MGGASLEEGVNQEWTSVSMSPVCMEALVSVRKAPICVCVAKVGRRRWTDMMTWKKEG